MSKSILGLCDYNIKLRLHNCYIIIALQLLFFLDMSSVKHIIIFIVSLVKNFLT